ncbi:MAG: hypothetical protein IKJ59_00360 [Clostridia bacterium]|nr:hypothetical protein [Clostridia bacterium]
MTLQERLSALREKIKAKITPESSPEELDEYNGMLQSLDEIETEHNKVVETSAKYRDTIVRMVINQGDDKTPGNPSDEDSKPKSMDEFLDDFKQKQEK